MSFNSIAADEQTEPGGAHIPYLPGLDGLRAIAVVAVLLYHAGTELWGGFLGVESFFVLSGYLITALLLAEWQLTGRIDLGAFWRRRARRLLPALFLLLAGTLAIAAIFAPEELTGLFDDTLAAFAYVTNWFLIFSNQPYFDPMVRPSLMQHLWSLAVEEQFYLLWPILFMLGIRFLGRPGLLVAIVAGIGASLYLMTTLSQIGVDQSRAYYGTDTRASGLLLGAALALLWSPGRPPLASSRVAGYLLDGTGALALCGLIASFVLLDEYHPMLYPYGFAGVALLTLLLIAAISHPQARILPRLLGILPLRWLGTRSYGIYLWHWPIFMVTRPYMDVPFDGWQLLALRMGIVLILADLSYRIVEMPIRRGAIERAWQHVTTARRANQLPATRSAQARNELQYLTGSANSSNSKVK